MARCPSCNADFSVADAARARCPLCGESLLASLRTVILPREQPAAPAAAKEATPAPQAAPKSVRCPVCEREIRLEADLNRRVTCLACGTTFSPHRVRESQWSRLRSATELTGHTLGGYRIMEKLGDGGMGVVYRAEHTVLDRVAAVKVLKPHLAENHDFRERFLREAHLASTLQHPSIVKVFEAAVADDIPYIAMEFVRGTTLARIVETEGPLDPHEAAWVVLCTCGALQSAHDAGVLHRDIKPENLMISTDGDIKLTDFGLARSLKGTTFITQPDLLSGTPGYIAPEHLEGEELDQRYDVYALGATFYFLLTGAPPYAGEDPLTVLFKSRWEQVRPPIEVVPSIPRLLSDVCAKMLSKSRSTRYRSCRDVAKDLQAFLEGHDVAVDVPKQVPDHELPFGAVALREKFITQEQLLHCIRVQAGYAARGEPAPLIGEIMVREKLIPPENVPLVLGLQSPGKARCPSCSRMVEEAEAVRYRYRCPTCRCAMRVLPQVNVHEKPDEVRIEVKGACLHPDLLSALRPVMESVAESAPPNITLDLTGFKCVADQISRHILDWSLGLADRGKHLKVLASARDRDRFDRLGLTQHVKIETVAGFGKGKGKP
jgi:predicted Ser/Thr protein kinase